MNKKKKAAVRKTAGKIAAVVMVLMLAAGMLPGAGCMAAYGEGSGETSGRTESSAAAGDTVGAESGESSQTSSEVDVSGSDSRSEKELSELKESKGVVLFAESGDSLKPVTEPAPSTDKVVLKYSKVVWYENYSTHYFKVTFDGKTRIAYCVQPKLQAPSRGTKTAHKYNNSLMTKALYYSYGYPGYDKRTRSYVSKKDIDDYDDDYGAYALSHMVLSYIYDNESSKSDAFTGVSSSTRKLVRDLTEMIDKKWPEPPSDASLSLSKTNVTAKWDSSENVQKTPVIKLRGHSDNRINMKIPKYCTMVKTGDGVTKKYTRGKDNSKKVKVFSGDSFYFTAPATVKGTFKSPEMEGVLSTFQPYLIKVTGKQNIVFCGVGATTSVSFRINWVKAGKVKLVKKSEQPELTGGSECYSLEGAVYGVYSKDTGKLVKKFTTDKDGKAEADGITRGNYVIRELTPPRGYVKDDREYDIKVGTGTASAEVSDRPEYGSVGIVVRKKDRETGNSDVAYGAALEGAQYIVKFYSAYYDSVSDIADRKPDRQWTVSTDKDGKAALDKEHFMSGDNFFSDPSGRTVLPLGTVTIQESKAPEGYLAGDEIFLRKISKGDNGSTVADLEPVEHKEQIIRGDVGFTKVHGGTGSRLAGIPFEITSEDTGETITVETDSSGLLTTVASGKYIGRKDKGEAKDSKDGALPYGSYVINEVRCEKNKGLQLVKGLKFRIESDHRTVDLGEVKDNELKIGTSASDAADGDKTAEPGQSVSITDRVSYEGLDTGTEYTLKGVLMDKKTGHPIMSGGRKVTASKTFTPESASGTVDVTFTFDASDLGGKTLVVFETLIENGVTVAEHKDLDSAEQTVEIAKRDSSADTGDSFPWIPAASAFVTAAAAAAVVLVRRRRY